MTIADPAVGTGTFLLGVLRRIAKAAEDDMGPGAVPGAVAKAAERLIGFELQFGPFAVAQLRLIAEFQGLMQPQAGSAPAKVPDLRLYVTDTLGDPFVEEDWIPSSMGPIAASRREANAIKKAQPIMVVIGNPPYKEKAQGRGGWIEAGTSGARAPLDWWQPPRDWGVGAHTKHLKNLYIYFWRWASWKVFGAGQSEATGKPDTDEEGIVCYITVAGFLNGPGFQRMRDDLRRSCTDIWVIDCSPEGHQPEVNTRIFQGVQHPVCITLAARRKGKDAATPARVHHRSLARGRREAKFAELAAVSLYDGKWDAGSSSWRDSFLPEAEGAWADFLPLKDVFLYDGSGVMPGRTWVIAPDRETLERRWARLIAEKDATKKEVLFHPQLRKGKVASRHIRKIVEQRLGDRAARTTPVILEQGANPTTGRYGFRSLDRQWLIADARMLNDVRPVLWDTHVRLAGFHHGT